MMERWIEERKLGIMKNKRRQSSLNKRKSEERKV
jgi:hypothetical protein